jgi:hypothetical protein
MVYATVGVGVRGGDEIAVRLKRLEEAPLRRR